MDVCRLIVVGIAGRYFGSVLKLPIGWCLPSSCGNFVDLAGCVRHDVAFKPFALSRDVTELCWFAVVDNDKL